MFYFIFVPTCRLYAMQTLIRLPIGKIYRRPIRPGLFQKNSEATR
jgi:hypothetical protein